MEHPLYSPDLALNDFWLFKKKTESTLKGTKISGYWRHKKKKLWRLHLKLSHNESLKNVANIDSTAGLSAWLLNCSASKVHPVSKLLSIQAWGLQ
jgi:hypothetical protein